MTTTTDNPLAAIVQTAPTPTAPPWLASLRREAADSFLALGLPSIRHEEWRWTPLKSLTAQTYQPATPTPVAADAIAPFLIPGADEIRLVFVDGFFDESLSRLPKATEGILIAPMSRTPEDEGLASKIARYADHHAQPFTALNTALFADAAYIRAGRDAALDTPVHVIHVSTGGKVSAPRTLLMAGDNARLDLIESYVGLGTAPAFSTAVTEIVAQAGARVRHVKLLRESDATTHIGWNEARVERDADYRHFSIALDAGLARNDLRVSLNGEGGHCGLTGLVLGRGSQHFDNHLVVDHVRPHCTSDQFYRVVVDGKSRSVFSGKVIVRPGAAGTDAKQQNNNLLLSDDARADTKPQLEIYCDDVKCSHGATSGQLDEQALFFLRSRGLDRKQARDVLTYAFAGEAIERIEIEPVRKAMEALMHERFQGLEMSSEF